VFLLHVVSTVVSTVKFVVSSYWKTGIFIVRCLDSYLYGCLVFRMIVCISLQVVCEITVQTTCNSEPRI